MDRIEKLKVADLTKEELNQFLSLAVEIIKKRIDRLSKVSEKENLTVEDVDYLTRELAVFNKDSAFRKIFLLGELSKNQVRDELVSLAGVHRELLFQGAEKALRQYSFWSRVFLDQTEGLGEDEGINKLGVSYALGRARGLAGVIWNGYEPGFAGKLFEREVLAGEKEYLAGLISAYSETFPASELPQSALEMALGRIIFGIAPDREGRLLFQEFIRYAGEVIKDNPVFQTHKGTLEKKYGVKVESLFLNTELEKLNPEDDDKFSP